MTYHVSLLPAARRQFSRLDPQARRRISGVIDALAEQPRPAGVKALKGLPGALRVRAGAFRIVYRVEDRELLVLVMAIGHRRDVCRPR